LALATLAVLIVTEHVVLVLASKLDDINGDFHIPVSGHERRPFFLLAIMAKRTENAAFSGQVGSDLSENCLKPKVENVYNRISGCKQRS
jgi:hypothetical protein